MRVRLSLGDFADLIRREGGIVPLFMDVGVSPDWAPAEIQSLVGDANGLEMRLRAVFDQIAEACGYDPDEES